MKSFPSLALAAVLLLGCGDDAVKPGDLLVKWSHGPTATCDSRHVVKVEARAYLKDVLEDSVTVACPAASSGGDILLEGLTPGNYRVVVEAFNSDTPPKGVYLGSADRQPVREGGSTQTTVITLSQKPVRLNIKWTTPTGIGAGSPVREVLVQYVPFQGTVGEVVHEQTVPCNNEVADPDDPSEILAGVLFTDLVPNADVKVFAYGLDATGVAIAKGEVGPFALVPGDDAEETISLTTCLAIPANCGRP